MEISQTNVETKESSANDVSELGVEDCDVILKENPEGIDSIEEAVKYQTIDVEFTKYQTGNLDSTDCQTVVGADSNNQSCVFGDSESTKCQAVDGESTKCQTIDGESTNYQTGNLDSTACQVVVDEATNDQSCVFGASGASKCQAVDGESTKYQTGNLDSTECQIIVDEALNNQSCLFGDSVAVKCQTVDGEFKKYQNDNGDSTKCQTVVDEATNNQTCVFGDNEAVKCQIGGGEAKKYQSGKDWEASNYQKSDGEVKQSPTGDDKVHYIQNSDGEGRESISNDGETIQDHELAVEIEKQVAYLFSDDNIWKDKFLLKHVFQSKDGFVSLKLLLSMKKVRALSKDWKVVANSLKNSKGLDLNEDMTKVRRVVPISARDIPHKTSYSTENPLDSSSPRLSPAAYKKQVYSPLTKPADEDASGKLMQQAGSKSETSSPTPSKPRWIRSNSNDSSRWTDDSLSSPTFEGYRSRKSRRERNNLVANPNDGSGDDKPMLSSRYKSDSALNNRPWQRRQIAAGCEKKRVVIIRQPRGPDGTIGFHAGRSKMKLKSPKINAFEL